MVSFLASDSDSSSDDEGYYAGNGANSNSNNSAGGVSPTMLDLNMKQMVVSKE